jgi:hypothetical protein
VNTLPAQNGTARRLRQKTETAAARTSIVMSVVVCPECGQRFAISHDPAAQDPVLAERQATWLQDQFVWDHIQESKHRALIMLPASADIK